MFVMDAGGGLEPSKGVSCLRPKRVLTMGEREREREIMRDCGVYFTTTPWWAPNVFTKI